MTTTIELDGMFVPITVPLAAVAVASVLSADKLKATLLFAFRLTGDASGLAALKEAKRLAPDAKWQTVSLAPTLQQYMASDSRLQTVILRRAKLTDAWVWDGEEVRTQTGPSFAPAPKLAQVTAEKLKDALRAVGG